VPPPNSQEEGKNLLTIADFARLGDISSDSPKKEPVQVQDPSDISINMRQEFDTHEDIAGKLILYSPLNRDASPLMKDHTRRHALNFDS